MKPIKQLTWMAIVAVSLIACKGKGGSGTKKGSDLKGEDAKAILAGKENKYWILDSGHDYYEYIQFETNNNAIITGGNTITYTVNGDAITMKDYKDLVYKIVEVSDDKLVMGSPSNDTLTFLYFAPGTEEAKKRSAENAGVNAKWLKGKFGTAWKFSEGAKMYSYMNDGRILDASTLSKIADWKVEGKILQFGENKCAISRLSPIFFDYDAFGIPVKMNYIGEVKADGTLAK
jgi:hypothetical protein